MKEALTLVAAYGLGREMGAGGDLPWQRDLPADLRHFRELTVGKTAIMGYRTYRSIGRPLAERENIVVTSKRLPCGILTARSLEEAVDKATHEPVVIGGAGLYQDALPFATAMYATEVQAWFPAADTFFPELSLEFTEQERIQHAADEANAYAYDFVTYRRDD